MCGRRGQARRPVLQERLNAYVDEHRDRLVEITRELVRRPSENMPPKGSEGACQLYAAQLLREAGWQPELYPLDDAPGLREHPLFFGGRDYNGRPNLGARRKGRNGGRSLVLSGHIDTVPRGTQPWTVDAFGGEVRGNRLYGRGSNDMKGGIATNLFVAEAVASMDLPLRGDLMVEAVVDEEFGGVNGTLAGRLRGFNGDAAVISEPSFLRVCPAQRGGRTAHITFRGAGGILTEGKFPAGVIDQLTFFLSEAPRFAAARRAQAPPHEAYAAAADPVPVSVMKVVTGPWGTTEPMTTPESCQVELFWQAMPGESRDDVERAFFDWFDALVASRADLFPTRPEVESPIRWLPGSAIAKSQPLVRELSACAAGVLGREPVIAGIEGPCDMYVFHEFGIAAVLWGARGGNTHAADEYVEIDSLVAAARTLLLFVCRWCGV